MHRAQRYTPSHLVRDIHPACGSKNPEKTAKIAILTLADVRDRLLRQRLPVTICRGTGGGSKMMAHGSQAQRTFRNICMQQIGQIRYPKATALGWFFGAPRTLTPRGTRVAE